MAEHVPPAEEDPGGEVRDDAVVEAPRDGRGGRGWRIAAVVSVALAGIAVGGLGSLMLGGSEREALGTVLACVVEPADATEAPADSDPDCPPEGAPYTDGLVEKAEGGDFTIREIQQGRLGDTIELFVRREDRPYIDIQHAQTHAALGQPVRVYTKKYEGREVVVYMEDSPLLK